MIKKTILFSLIINLLFPLIQPSANVEQFKDIKGHWAKEDILFMKENGIVSGKEQGLFDPDSNVTRAEFSALLLRTLDITPVLPENLYFKDIDPTKWYAGTVETAYRENLIGGYPNGTFLPDHPITRQEMAVLLIRALKKFDDLHASLNELDVFNDKSSIGRWAKEEIAIAVKKGVIGGLPDDNFAPNQHATRAQSVVTLNRLLSHIDQNIPANHQKKDLSSLALDVSLTEWKVDEAQGYIFGISENNNNLYVVNMNSNSLQLEKKIQLNSNAKDLEIFNNKLYITIPEKKVIDVIDINTLKRMKSINVLFKPDQIAIDHSNAYTKLFYTEYTEANLVILSMVDLRDNKEEPITKKLSQFPNNVFDLNTQYSHPDLAVDRTNHVLYLGESSSSASTIFAMDTDTYSRVKGKSSGYSYPFKKVIVDGDEIFYAGKKLKANQLSYELGTYPHDEILFVKDQYVLTKTNIYHRDHFNYINSYRYSAQLAYMDNDQHVYIFNAKDQTIRKLKLDLSIKNTRYKSDGHRLTIGPEITEWVFDPDRPYVYAISEHNNKLYYIRTDTLTIEDEMFIGAEPSGIDLYENKIYVTHYGTKDIYITDRYFTNQYDIISLDSYQEDIEVSKDNIYYESIDWMVKRHDNYEIANTRLKKYNYNTKQASEISVEYYNRYGNIDIELSEDEMQLYLKESNQIKIIDTNEVSLIKQAALNPAGGTLIVDMNELFTSSKKLNRMTLQEIGDLKDHVIAGETGGNQISGDVQEIGDQIIAVTNQYVFSKNKVYSRSDLTKIATLSHDIKMAGTDSNGHFLVMSNQQLYKYDFVDAFIEEKKVPLRLEEEIMDWEYNKENNKIYAVTKSYSTTNELLVINASNLTIEDKIYLSNYDESHPNIGLHNNHVYIPYLQSGEIKVINLNSKEVVNVIKAEKPLKVFVKEDKLLYLSQVSTEPFTKEGYLYIYDLETEEKHLLKDDKQNPILLREIDNFVYDPLRREIIIESSYYKDEDQRELVTYTDLKIFDSDTLTLTQSAQFKDYQLQTNMVVDQNGIFLDKLLLKRDNIKNIMLEFPHSIIYATDQYAFDGTNIYNRENGQKIGTNQTPLRRIELMGNNKIIAHEFNQHIFHIWDLENLLR